MRHETELQQFTAISREHFVIVCNRVSDWNVSKIHLVQSICDCATTSDGFVPIYMTVLLRIGNYIFCLSDSKASQTKNL